MNANSQGELSRYKKRKRIKFNGYDIFVTLFCVVFAFVCFYPIWYVFIVSITPYSEFVRKNFIFLFPSKIDLQYYLAVLSTTVFKNSLTVSVIKTIPGTALSIILTSMMAYGVSKKQVPGMKIINFLVVLTMYFGGGLIPTYFLYRDISMIKTIWPMLLPMAVNVSYFVVMRNYYMYSIPSELEEAALLDGANQFTAFFRIILPTSKPMIAAVSLFIAVAHWNDWYSFMMFVNVVKLQPFSWVLRRVLVEPSFINSLSSEAQAAMGSAASLPPLQLRMTTIILSTLPILILYPFLQKYFTQGLMLGAVKE